jgi:hypothetical protein
MEPRGPAVGNSSDKKEGRGEMTKTPMSLQDLRRRIYVKAKAEPAWRKSGQASAGNGGVGTGCTANWDSSMGTECDGRKRKHAQPIGHITLGTKPTGARSAGNPHATCDEAGAGNGPTVRLVRHSQRKQGAPDRPHLKAPRQPSTLLARGSESVRGAAGV